MDFLGDLAKKNVKTSVSWLKKQMLKRKTDGFLGKILTFWNLINMIAKHCMKNHQICGNPSKNAGRIGIRIMQSMRENVFDLTSPCIAQLYR